MRRSLLLQSQEQQRLGSFRREFVPSFMKDDDNLRSIQETSESGITVLDFDEVEAYGILAKYAFQERGIENGHLIIPPISEPVEQPIPGEHAISRRF